MDYLIALWGLGLAITVHELGHFLVLKRKGLVKSVNIGIPIPGVTLGFARNGISYRFSPFLLGGAVELQEDGKSLLEKESVLFQLAASSAGILANLIFAALVVFVTIGWQEGIFAGLKSGLGVLIFSFTEGIPFIYSLVIHPSQLLRDVAGPIGAIRDINQMVGTTTSFGAKLSISLMFSNFAIGLCQLLPFPPLDGFKILLPIPQKILGERAKRVISNAENALTLLTLGFLVFLLVKDIFQLF